MFRVFVICLERQGRQAYILMFVSVKAGLVKTSRLWVTFNSISQTLELDLREVNPLRCISWAAGTAYVWLGKALFRISRSRTVPLNLCPSITWLLVWNGSWVSLLIMTRWTQTCHGKELLPPPASAFKPVA